MAICMPFIFLLIISSVELSAGLFQQHTVRLTAHQCAIVAANRTTTSNEIQDLANQILSQRGYTTFDIEINEVPRTVNGDSVVPAPVSQFLIPSTGATTPGLEDVPRGTLLRLSINAPRPQIVGMGFALNFMQPDIVAECVFVKEQ